jgi:integrase
VNEPYLDAAGLAQHLGVSPRTIRVWIKAGDIPHDVLPGGAKRKARRFRASDVEAWLGSTGGSRKSYNPGHMGLFRYKTGKNKSDTWHYWFTIDGQRTYASTGTPDHSKAKEIYVAAYNAALEGKRQPRGHITLGEAIEGYLGWCKAENKTSTYHDKTNRVNAITRHFDKKRRLASLDVADIEGYKIKRKSEKAWHRESAPSEATINRELSLLQGLFTWAVAWRKVAASPFDTGSIKKYKETASEGKYLNADQKQKLIEVSSEKLRPLVVTALSSGMRLSELRRLQWRHVNLDPNIRALQIVDTKSKKNRTAKMGPGLVDLFKRLPKRSELVYTHEDGRTLSVAFIEEHFGKACDRAGITNFTFHDLRDVFSTDFYQQTKDIRKLQRVLGHSSIATTERYLATLGLGDSTEVDAMSDGLFTESVRKSLGMQNKDAAQPEKVL